MEIVDITDVCRNFPLASPNEIEREAHLDAIENAFTSGYQVAFVEGPDGLGKTTLLSQFMKRRHLASAGVFITAANTMSYGRDALNLTITEQLSWLLDGVRYPGEDASAAEVMKLMLRLQKHAKKEAFVFVIDGLAEIPSADRNDTISYLFQEALQLGIREFRFLISGSKSDITVPGLDKIRNTTLPLIPFDTEQVRRYLSPVTLSEAELSEIKQFTRGHPSRLEVIRRSLTGGETVDSIITGRYGEVADFFHMDWERILHTEEVDLALAVVAFARHSLTWADVSRITSLEFDYLKSAFSEAGFFDINAATDAARFRSESNRKLMAKRLEKLHSEVTALNIADFTSRSADNDSLRFLPEELATAGKDTTLVEQVNNEHFRRLLKCEQSMDALKRHADLARISSERIRRVDSTMHFAITGAMIRDIERSNSSRAFVQALMKLGRLEDAVTVAGTATTKEDRFALLAVIGKNIITSKKSYPDELRAQLEAAARHVDLEKLGARGAEIAGDLIAIDADLAVEVLKAGIGSEQEVRQRDLAFASLHMSAAGMNLSATAREAAGRKTIEMISNSRVQAFVEAASAAFSKYDSAQAIAKIERLEAEHRLYFARIWLNVNFAEPDAIAVANYALRVIVEQTTHLPKLSDFRAIARVLTTCDKPEEALSLLGRIDAQKGIIAANGTTEDEVRLQLLFLVCEARLAPQKAAERATSIFTHIDDIVDLQTKTTCFAWVLHHLHDCPNLDRLDIESDVLRAVADSLVICSERLLESTVDHFTVTKQALRALASNNTQQALALIRRFNTQHARDKAYRYLSLKIAASRGYRNGFSSISECVGNIRQLVIHDHAILDILSRVHENGDFLTACADPNSLLSLWPQLKGPDSRFLALAYTFAILKPIRDDGEIIDGFETKLAQYWDDIPRSGYRHIIGFQAIEILADCASEIASKWMDRLLQEYQTRMVPTEETEPAILCSIGTAIHCYAGLAKNGRAESQWPRLVDLLENIPGVAERNRMWVDLAVRCWAAGQPQKLAEISEKYIRPIIEQIGDNYNTWRSYLLLEASPIIYLASANLAEAYLDTMPRAEQDEARERICMVLMSKRSPYDPTPQSTFVEYELDYAVALDVLAVLKRMRTDSLIFSVATSLCESLSAKKNKSKISYQQKKTILTQLLDFIEQNLPDNDNIAHAGYLIAIKAKILRSRSEFERIDMPLWNDLKEQADSIPNVADRALVQCILAVQIASRDLAVAKQWLGDVRAATDLIPSARDRIERYRWMTEMVGKIDPSFCQYSLKSAFSLSMTQIEDPDAEERQRRLLDVAHQVDPRFADHLLQQLDVDPARAESKRLVSHVGLLNKRKKIFQNEDQTELLSDDDLLEICARNYRSLISSRLATRKIEDMGFILRRASHIPLRQARPMLSWFVENAKLRFEQSQRESAILSHLLEGSLSAAELGCHLSGFGFSRPLGSNSVTMFKDGERDAALGKFRAWLESLSEDQILLSDPYFGPDDLDFLQLIQEVRPNSHIRMLLSDGYVRKYAKDKDFESAFREKWGDISDQLPPRTDIVLIACKAGGGHPIHDRWLLSSSSGLRIGTSIHSVGIGRTADISELTSQEVLERHAEITNYLNRNVRELSGARVTYSVVDL